MEIPVISESQVWNLLCAFKRTATGPDQIPYWVWKERAEIFMELLNLHSVFAIIEEASVIAQVILLLLLKWKSRNKTKHLMSGPSGNQLKGVITWDRDELGPVWVRIALRTFLFMRLHGTGLKTNSERCRWPDTRYFRTGLRLYFSCKTETNLRPGRSINSMFLRMAPSFLLFVSKIRTLLWIITVNKTWK